MKRLGLVLAAVMLLAAVALGQSSGPVNCGDASVTFISCRPAQQTIANSGDSITINNYVAGVTASFEELITGAPATVSIVIKGCMRGTTCDTLDTYTTVANAIRKPTISSIYDYFTITASWTGGSSVSVKVNTAVTTARNGGGGSLAIPGSSGLCLVSNGSTAGAYAWASCAGSTSTNFSAMVADGPNVSAGTFQIGNGTTLAATGTGVIAASTAAKLAAARTLAGNSFDGSANTAFTNKFIVQGTVDAGLSGAQFLGALSTGLLKNTTTTGVLSIAASGTDYAPATSGSSPLKGNGSGGFATATADDILPTQTSNSGKFLTTNGTTASWGTVSGSGTVAANNSSNTHALGVYHLAGGSTQVDADTGAFSDGAGALTAVSYATSGSNGGIGGTEGTGASATCGAAKDCFWPDSTAHRWKMQNNNGTAAQVVASGVDINTLDQVTATHLASALPVNQGGTGTTSTLTGLMRGNSSAMTAAELSGDCTTSGSNAVTCAAGTILDRIGSTRGSVLYRGVGGWAILTPGTSGQLLQAQGVGADPLWATVSPGSGYATVQDEGSGLTQRATINFIGAGVTCADNVGSTRTECTIPGGSTPGLTSAHIFVGNGSNVATDVALSGDVSILNTGASTVGAIQGKAADVPTTKGDLYVYDGSALKRLGVGSNTQVLTADSTAATGIKWAAAAGGAATFAVASKSAAYTITTSDFSAGATIVYTGTSVVDFTLPATAPSTNGQMIFVKNASNVSIFLYQGGASGLAIDGQKAPVLIAAGEGLSVQTDGTNYFTESRGNARRMNNRRVASMTIRDATPAFTQLNVTGTSSTAASGCVNVAVSTTDGFHVKCDTGTSINTSSVMNTAATTSVVSGTMYTGSTGSNFRFSGRFGFDDGAGGVTNTRAFVGVIDATAGVGAAGGPLQTDSPTIKFIGFQCSQSRGTPDTNWMAYWGDGTAGTPTSTGVLCTGAGIGVPHTFEVMEHGGNTAYFIIDGAVTNCVGADTGCTSAAAHYPAGTVISLTGVTTLAGAARRYGYWYWIQEETDK
jgi:hypothetical protein